jgi:hypothetical protein
MGAAGNIDERARKQGETNAAWRERIEQYDLTNQVIDGPLVTPEAERHGDYRTQFVMHVETYTLAYTRKNHEFSPFDALLDRGTITKEQYEAAMQIQMVAERVGRAASVRSASLEARVDNSRGGDLLVERLVNVQFEVAYSRWRQFLPVPKSMILDMILMSGPLKAKARSYGMGWPRARKRLKNALDSWIQHRDHAVSKIDEDDVKSVHYRLGGGIIT